MTREEWLFNQCEENKDFIFSWEYRWPIWVKNPHLPNLITYKLLMAMALSK